MARAVLEMDAWRGCETKVVGHLERSWLDGTMHLCAVVCARVTEIIGERDVIAAADYVRTEDLGVVNCAWGKAVVACKSADPADYGELRKKCV